MSHHLNSTLTVTTTGPQCYFRADDSRGIIPCPNISAAIAFSVIFTMFTATHAFGALYYKKRFCWILAFAAALEAAGFGVRASIVPDRSSGRELIASALLIGLAPLIVTLFSELAMFRMIYHWLPQKKIWNVRVRTWYKATIWFTLVNLIILPFALGRTGYSGVIIFSLAQASILVSCGMLATFIISAKNNTETRPKPYRPFFNVIATTFVLLTIRTTVVFVAMGSGIYREDLNNLLNQVNLEINIDVFDAGAMAVIMLLFAIFHPGRSMPGPEGNFTPLQITKGARSWRTCGRRHKTVIDPDFTTIDPPLPIVVEERGVDGVTGIKLTESPATTRGDSEEAWQQDMGRWRVLGGGMGA